MELFNYLFKQKTDKKMEQTPTINWLPLTDIAQLEDIKQASKTQTVLIFKHSTRCGISKMVIKQFEKLITEDHKSIKIYYLDLLNYRSLSDEVGYTFQVHHQSPQLLVIKNEVCVHHASHYDITQIDLLRFVS